MRSRVDDVSASHFTDRLPAVLTDGRPCADGDWACIGFCQIRCVGV